MLCAHFNRRARECAECADRARDSVALTTLYARCEAGADPSVVLPLIMAARERVAVADRQQAELATASERRDWLHSGERPGPLLSAKLRRPQGSAGIAAVRTPAGPLTGSPAGIATVLAKFFADVSAAPASSPLAQQAVLRSMAAAPQLSAADSALLDSPLVTVAEVCTALRRARPGTAPGPDGLPMDLFRKYREQFAPLLSRLFSVLASGSALPTAFHDGAIAVLHKAGDRTDPANYRPITLLNADYRAYTRVLASRLSAVLPSIIDAQQTAFLGKRCMGETIQLLQLLPRALAVTDSGAVVVSCDIRKAYDTVCRDFLQHSMAALGVGSGFRQVVGRLLSHTRARVFVNGALSEPATFHAGVRQDYPLAPLLYLFVGQSLSCFLRARGIGIMLGGLTLSAAQFADDTTAFMRTLSDLPSFTAAMTCFGEASGQRLNPAKTNVLLLGDLAVGAVAGTSPGTVAAGPGVRMRLVREMSVLGILLAASPRGLGQATIDWAPRLDEVARRAGKIASLPLSGFGRGFAASAYGLSSVLFHAEFCGLPPKLLLSRLQSQVAALVDHKRDPAGHGPRQFHGIAAANQFGTPAAGGFGVLALAEHVAVRHAMWGLRLVQGLSVPVADHKPWVRAAWLALPLRCSANPLSVFAWRPSSRQLLDLPMPLRRICEGTALLPPFRGSILSPLVLGVPLHHYGTIHYWKPSFLVRLWLSNFQS